MVPPEDPAEARPAQATASRAAWPWALAVAAPLLARLLILLLSPGDVNQDVALYLECGRQLLDGGRPYVDFLDLNPPWVMYLHALPVALSRATGAPVIVTFHLLVLGAQLAVMAWVATWWRRSEALRALWPGRLTAVLFAFWALFVGFDYGQREHLLLVLLAPLLVLRFAQAQGASPAGHAGGFFAGLLGGLVLVLKPHFLVCWLLPELAGWRNGDRQGFRKRSLSPFLGVVAAGVAYVALLVSMPAESRQAFFGRVLPLVARGYGAYGELAVAFSNRTVAVAALIGLVAMVRSRRHPALGVLGGFTLGGALSYVAQGKGWHYHALPALAGASFCVALAAELFARRGARATASPVRRSTALARWWPASLAVLLLVWTGLRTGVYLRWHRDGAERPWSANAYLDFARRHAPPGDAVGFLSTSVSPAFPTLVQGHFAPASRHLWLFPLAMERWRLGADAPLSDEERRTFDELRADFAARRPAVVFVDRRCQGCPEGFDLSAWLDTHGLLDELLAGYTPRGEVLDRRVWVR